MLSLILPQLVAKTAGKMALRWPRLGFSSHFLQPIYLSLQKTSASPLSLSIYLSKSRAPLKLGPYLREKNAIQGSFAGKAALERGLPWARVGKELALAWRRPAFILSWPGGAQAPPRSSCAAFAKLEVEIKWFFAGLTTLFFVRQFR